MAEEPQKSPLAASLYTIWDIIRFAIMVVGCIAFFARLGAWAGSSEVKLDNIFKELQDINGKVQTLISQTVDQEARLRALERRDDDRPRGHR